MKTIGCLTQRTNLTTLRQFIAKDAEHQLDITYQILQKNQFVYAVHVCLMSPWKERERKTMSKNRYTFKLGKHVEPPYNMFSKKSKYWNKLRHNSRILRWHNLGVKHITYKAELIYKKSSLDHQRTLLLLLGDPRWILYQTRFKNTSKKLKEYTEGEMTFLERFMTVPSRWFPLMKLEDIK